MDGWFSVSLEYTCTNFIQSEAATDAICRQANETPNSVD